MAAKTPIRASVRDYLVRAIMAQAEEKVRARHLPLEDAMVREALASVYGPNAVSSFAAAPNGWLPKVSILYVKAGPTYARFNLKESIPVPYNALHQLAVTDPIVGQRCKQLHDNLQNERGRLGDLEVEAKQQLAQIRSLERLQEEWPEAYALLLPEHKGSPNLPAKALVDVRARFAALENEGATT